MNFIGSARAADNEFDWVLAVSPVVANQLEAEGIALQNARVFPNSPARSIQARWELKHFEREVSPALVFTFFGPAYVTFRAFHLCGVANPWVTHPNRYAYSVLSIRNALFFWLDSHYKAHWYRRADAWVVEEEVAREGLIRLLHFPAQRIDVVRNTCGDRYRTVGSARLCTPKSDQIRIFVFSAYYAHKDLELIPDVAAALQAKRPELNFEFVLSLPVASAEFARIRERAKALGVQGRIRTVGVVDVGSGPDVYAACDISFLPTLLETSSAVFPESMAMGLPLVTTRMDFNTAVCKDAALYFQPRNAVSAAETLLRLVDDEQLWRRCVREGRELVSAMFDQSQKYQAYLSCIRKYLRPNADG